MPAKGAHRNCQQGQGTAIDPQTGIPFNFNDYVQLLDWTGRAIRDDKRGSINNTLPPILERLEVKPDQWLYNSTRFEQFYQKQWRQRKT